MVERLDRMENIFSVRLQNAHGHVGGGSGQAAGGFETCANNRSKFLRRGKRQRRGQQEWEMACRCKDTVMVFRIHFDGSCPNSCNDLLHGRFCSLRATLQGGNDKWSAVI